MPDRDHLKMAAAIWCAGDPADQRSTRQFLSMFAVYLVKHFRAEEHRLQSAKAPELEWHRREHRQLVRQLRDLMMDLDLGLEVTRAVHAFLEAWRVHQASASLRRTPAGSLGH